MDKILIFGGKGQLGQCLRAAAPHDDRLLFLSSSEADICDESRLTLLFKQYTPRIVINCAAYTAVDKAEDEVEAATLLNAHAPAVLAGVCKAHQTELVHISTDFVFGGDVTGWLAETDQTQPLGVYGQTKLDGEKAIQQIWERHVIIRTSWLYAEYGNNFVKTMMRLAQERDELRIVADQVGTPTYGMDLAKVILLLIDSPEREYGIYHYSNEGTASWYDFAHAILRMSHLNTRLLPIPTSAFPTKAQRPAYSVMDKSKIKAQFNIIIPHWRDSLQCCLEKILSENS